MRTVNEQLVALPGLQAMDPAQFGAVERVALSKRQRLGGQFLTRNALCIPHVTHHDDIDITGLEERRRQRNGANEGHKLTLLPLVVSAVVSLLKINPKFNAALDEGGDALILKKYFNIGVAVDTAEGLLVPVIRGCDTKTVGELASEIEALAGKAREKGLSMAEMSGGCITISSLGHIGGTGFTPIINAPEVALLGICRARAQPTLGADGRLYNRTMLPVSLSYDHRAINGADAARFARGLEEVLGSAEFLETAFLK